MAKILVFVKTRKALERWDSVKGTLIISSMYPPEQRAKAIETFCAMRDDGVLVVQPPLGRAEGWRVPSDTLVVFDPSWDWPMDHPNSIQAKARVRMSPFDLDLKTLGDAVKLNVEWHAPFNSSGGLGNQSLSWLLGEAEARGLDVRTITTGGRVHDKRQKLVQAIAKHVYAQIGVERSTPESLG